MKFSIIIPVYNVEKYLCDCLDSVLNQSYPDDYEVICVNDGSTDESLYILKNYADKDKRIKVVSQENKGLSVARNRGINAATGKYIFFLDSDDWLETNALEILSHQIDDEDIICFNGHRYFEDGSKEELPDKGIIENNLTGWDYYNKYALISRKFHFVCVVLRLYNRDFLLKNQLFFEEEIYHEDNLFTPIVCYYAKKVKVIPDILYVYRIRDGSITWSVNLKKLEDIIKVANKLSDFFIPKTDIDKSIVFREIAGEYFSVYMSPKAKVFGKDYTEVRSLINWKSFKTVSVYPRHKRIYKLIKLHPVVFSMYIRIEQILKKSK